MGRRYEEMKCINCGSEMVKGLYGYHSKCTACNITYNHLFAYSNDFKWDIPKELKPTEKQINTIRFINNRVNKPFAIPLTKREACKIISENFDKIKDKSINDRLHRRKHSSVRFNITDMDCDIMGIDASMFY